MHLEAALVGGDAHACVQLPADANISSEISLPGLVPQDRAPAQNYWLSFSYMDDYGRLSYVFRVTDGFNAGLTCHRLVH